MLLEQGGGRAGQLAECFSPGRASPVLQNLLPKPPASPQAAKKAINEVQQGQLPGLHQHWGAEVALK